MAGTQLTPNVKRKIKNNAIIATLKDENEKLRSDKESFLREIKELKSKLHDLNVEEKKASHAKLEANVLNENKLQNSNENFLLTDTKDNSDKIKIFKHKNNIDVGDLEDKKVIIDSKNDIKTLVREIENLKNKPSTFNADIAKLNIEKSDFNLDIDELVVEKTKFTKEQEVIESLQREICDLKEEANKCKNEIVKLKNENSILVYEKDELIKKDIEYTEEIDNSCAEISKITEHDNYEIIKIDERFDLIASKAVLEEEIEKLKSDLQTKSTQIEHLLDEKLKINEKADKYKTTNVNLKEENYSLLENINTLQKYASNNTAKIEALTREKSDLLSCKEVLTNKIKELQVNFQNKTIEMDKTEQNTLKLREYVNELETNITSLKKDKCNLLINIDTFQKEANDATEKIESLTREKSDLLASREALTDKVEKLQVDVQDKKLLINNLEQEISKLNVNTSDNKIKIQSLEYENSNFSNVVQHLLIKVSELRIEIKNSLEAIANLKSEAKNNEASIHALVYENAEHFLVKENLTKKLDHYQKQIIELKNEHAIVIEDIKTKACEDLSQCMSEKTATEYLNIKLNDENNVLKAKVFHLENDISAKQNEIQMLMNDKINCFSYYQENITNIGTEPVSVNDDLIIIFKTLHMNLKEKFNKEIDYLSEKFNSLYPCDNGTSNTSVVIKHQDLIQELEEKTRICRLRFKMILRKDEEKRDADKEIKKQKKTIEDLEEKVVMLIEEIKELKLHIDLIEDERKDQTTRITEFEEKQRASPSPLRRARVNSGSGLSSRLQRNEFYDLNRNLNDKPKRKRSTEDFVT